MKKVIRLARQGSSSDPGSSLKHLSAAVSVVVRWCNIFADLLSLSRRNAIHAHSWGPQILASVSSGESQKEGP